MGATDPLPFWSRIRSIPEKIRDQKGLFLAVSLAVTLAGPSVRASEGADDPAVVLADRYAPVLMPRTQSERCGPGEAYLPIDVSVLWDRPDVVLRTETASITGPSESEVAAAGPDAHLDLPGNALRPGCDYERFEDSLGAATTVYARVVPDGDGGLALQYWMFYVYNDWNDRHEGDWEMIQLLFDAPDATAALEVGPELVAYAQHEGAELSYWDEGPIQVVDGTHPLVFPGRGSHASYFSSDDWFGKSAQSGFGCDDTSAPNTEVRPQVVLLADGALPAWTAFTGRWGEPQPSFNNGPTGPATKGRWTEPREWVDDEGRWGAVPLPAGGSKVTDFFCTATAAGSKVMFQALDEPWLVAAIGSLMVLAIGGLVLRTRWRPVVMPPSDEPRRGGQILLTAARVVRREPVRFGQLGLLLPLAGVLATALQAALFTITGVGALEGVLGRDSVFGGLFATAIGLVLVGPAIAISAVAAMEAVRHPESGRAGARGIVSVARRHTRAIGTMLVSFVVVFVGFATAVLVPVGLWWQARSAVAVPAALDSPTPFGRSAALTRGHRVRALGITWVAVAVGIVTPLLVGLAVLLLTDRSFTFVNLVSGAVGLFTVPFAGVIAQLQYDDLCARASVVPT